MKKYLDNPTDRMIQANKEEADAMLSLWGKKARKHPKTKRKAEKRS